MGLPRRACFIAGMVCIFLTSACTPPLQTRPIESTNTDDLPREIELRSVPFFPQERYQCGPASLAMVLASQGASVVPKDLTPAVYLPGRRGSLQAELVAAARGYDMLAYRLDPSLTQLLQELAAGNPVLVLQNLGLSWLPQWHYAVAVGYRLDTQQLVLHSGTSERRLVRLSLFERTWARAEHWAMVIVPAGAVPATATPMRYLEAASALETTGRIQAARKAYRRAARLWPENQIAWMGLGNTEYLLEDYASAEASFRAALARQPESAPAWNNLGYALAARGCFNAARAAAACANKLAPTEFELRTTWQKSGDRAPAPGPEECAPVVCRPGE